MSILCPHCNFEIMLVGVRPGRFSPKCQSCGQTFTLYVAPGKEKRPPMAATSHLQLHEMCLRMGMIPPKPFPAGASHRGIPKLEVKTRALVAAPVASRAPSPPVGPTNAAIIFDMLGETDTVEAINEPAEQPKLAPPSKKKKRHSRTESLAETSSARRETKARWWPAFKRRYFKHWLRRFGTPLDWIFAPWLRVALGLMILGGFAAWWMQNKGDQALQRAVQTAVASTSTRREVGVISSQSSKQAASSIRAETASDRNTAVMTSQPLSVSWLAEPVRLALSGWNACLAGLLILASAFCRGRLFSLTIILAAAIAMIGHRYDLPKMGQPLPWMTASAAAVIALYAFIILRRPEGA